jgi:electron transfer flavoprotein alpha/beta subunit
MFTTQLSGLMNRIFDKEEFSIEDGARLLAQAAVGEGNIYICGFGEMEVVAIEALKGKEPLANARILAADQLDELTSADRVLLVSRFSTDEDALQLGQQLVEKQIPFVAVSGAVSSDSAKDLTTLADVHIDTKVIKSMLPDESGERVGFPATIAALYIYFCLKFTLEEMLNEY